MCTKVELNIHKNHISLSLFVFISLFFCFSLSPSLSLSRSIYTYVYIFLPTQKPGCTLAEARCFLALGLAAAPEWLGLVIFTVDPPNAPCPEPPKPLN